MATTTPRPAIKALDPIAEKGEAEAARLQLSATAWEMRHLLDADDTSFAQLAAEHGDKVSTDADYPDWTAGGAS